MNANKRRLYLVLIGIIAGLGTWPVVEICLYFQIQFSGFLLFSVILGMVFGISMGAFFGSSAGIIYARRDLIIKGVLGGIMMGVVGAVTGFLFAQAALFIAGEYFIHSRLNFTRIGLPVSRALGWAILGIFTGMIDGLRSRCMNKFKVGILGGLVGGILGGLALEYIRLIFPYIAFARLCGLVIFGCLIGLCYGIVEARFSFGVLRLLNGKHKGREFMISQKNMSIGSTMDNDIALHDYNQIGNKHARVFVESDELMLETMNKKEVYANDARIKSHILKFEDIIRIGSARFIYLYK